MKEVFIGMSYAHNHNVIHRDLRLENIMVEKLENSQKKFNIKIIDWDHAIIHTP